MSLYIRDKKYKVMLNGQAYNLVMPLTTVYQFKSEILDDDGKLKSEEVPVKYYIFEDSSNENTGENETNGPVEYGGSTVFFFAYGYLDNNVGISVPVLYREADGTDPTTPDLEDPFYYVGTFEVDGNVYDKWQQINEASGNGWNDPAKNYVLTDQIVETKLV